jgi:hypothetical protein
MKRFALIAILLALFVVFLNTNEDGASRHTMREVPLSFEYDDSAYVLTENPPRVTLTLKEDFESVQKGERAGGEGPPMIVIERFDNPNNPGPLEWAEQYPQLSNYNLKMGGVSNTTVASFPGIRYQADGLYPSRNVIFSDGRRIFYLHGQYLDQNSRLYRDFDKIVDSMRLR